MSVTILLLPVAFAAASLVGGAGARMASRSREEETTEDGVTAVSVRTRMKDRGLLGLALSDLGAVEIREGASGVTALLDDHRVTMSITEEGVWEAHFAREDGLEADASVAGEAVSRLDTAYAARVQAAVADRIRAQADSAGFELVSETRDDDATVTMVLNVRDDG